MRAVLCAGLYPNVLEVLPPSRPGGEPSFKSPDGKVQLHPCSVNFGVPASKLGSRYVFYHEKVKTSAVFVRDCTPVEPYALLLFGGRLRVYHRQQVVTVDEWIQLRSHPQVGVLVKRLRQGLDDLLREKIMDPTAPVGDTGERIIAAIAALLQCEAEGGV